MPVAALLAIVVATGEAHDPATAVMVAVAAESLGAEVSVRLLQVNRPEEIDAAAIEENLNASAVVTLVWTDAAHLHARLRLHVAGSDRTVAREIAFASADSHSERGRTLGLAAASMWPEVAREAGAAVNAKPPAATEAAPASDARPVVAPAPDTTGAVPAPTVRSPAAAEGPSPAESRGRAGLGVIGAAGPDGSTPALGGRVEAALRIGSPWWLRLGLSLRRTTIGALAGHDYVGQLAGGVEWWPPALSMGGTAKLGLRADVMLLRHDVRGTVIPGQEEQHVRYVPAGDLLAQVALRVARRLEIMAAAGAEQAAGRTELRSVSTSITVATIPRFRLAAEVGLRVGF